jgi:hypothetical protein
VLPAEQPAEAQALDVHLLETLVLVRRLAGRLEVDGPLCDPVDIAGGCQDVVTEHMVRERDPMEDVLFRQACHLGNMADLDSVTRDDRTVRAYCSPGHNGFRLIAHRVEPYTAAWSERPSIEDEWVIARADTNRTVAKLTPDGIWEDRFEEAGMKLFIGGEATWAKR